MKEVDQRFTVFPHNLSKYGTFVDNRKCFFYIAKLISFLARIFAQAQALVSYCFKMMSST